MSKSNDIWVEIGYGLLFIPIAVITVWFALWVLCVGMYMTSSFNAYSRCSNRGYKQTETVVNYPKFWHADTVCYKGEGKENGVTL